MPIEILMPALSPTMTEGKLTRWAVKEGDSVTAGMVVAEIETDKATMEVEAVDDGRLGRILVPEGSENVAVNTPIAVLLGEGEKEGALANYKPNTLKYSAAAVPDAARPSAPLSSAPPPAPPPLAAVPVAPSAPRPPVGGTAASASPADQARPIFATPLARRMAAQSGIDLRSLAGSGPHGRIIKRDIETRLRGTEERVPGSVPQAPEQGGFVAVPLSAMRKTIARRMLESKQTAPHFYLTVDMELDQLLALRRQINDNTDYNLTVNDFVIRAAALALVKVPEANAIWGNDAILRSQTADISVAVALENGLITPIIRSADRKTVGMIAKEMRSLAERAKADKLIPEEYEGGTFSISNLGMYKIREFAAIINPPQSSILAVGMAEQRPIVRNGALAVATLMTCTLACDHRVLDGALGARLLSAIQDYVENPALLIV